MKNKTSPFFRIFLCLLLSLFPVTSAFAGITFIPGQGFVLTGADGFVLTGADGFVLTGADGFVLTGADGFVLTGADGFVLTGADALTYTGVEGFVLTGADSAGLQSIDPELAVLLNQLPDSSLINVFVVFHHMPTEADLDDLRAALVLGGTLFHNLPMAVITATRSQIAQISTLPSVRSIYTNKTFEFFTHDTRVITGQSKVASDAALTAHNNGLSVTGRGVTVAVLDTGIDGTHPDVGYGSQVIDNVLVADLQGLPTGFLYPDAIAGLPDTDLIMGHGTFVAGVVAGTGAASGGYYGGMAPDAKLLGISAGNVSLFFVLSGIDYILSHRVDRNIRVVNCSFGISGLFDAHDPVNIATKIMHDAGITVVFSAGNRGDQPNSLNPYSVAPWVIGVGAGTKDRKLSDFSSRGAAAYAPYHPTLIAPGENIVSARALGINLVGTAGLAGVLTSAQNDLLNIPLLYLPRYTMSSGTSFAAPHVAGTIALMLEAAPQLAPDQIKQILQETATPMLGNSRYEVGAGYLNTYAAVRKASLGTPYGSFRGQLGNGVSYDQATLTRFNGEVAPGSTVTATFEVPDDAVFSTIEAGWVNTSLLGSNLSITVSRGSVLAASKPALLLAGQGVQKAGVTLNEPAAGTWTISILNAGLPVSGPQEFVVAIETMRANYGLSDINQSSPSDQQTIKRAIRTGLMTAPTGAFAAGALATRLDLARALALGAGARVPQSLPASPTFSDVTNGESAIFVESVVNSPAGNLMGATGPLFNPQSAASRATVAIAVVKALGLENIALTSTLINPGVSDWLFIPLSQRGYVSVAVSRNLMRKVGNAFRPSDSITRGDLAWTASALQQAVR